MSEALRIFIIVGGNVFFEACFHVQLFKRHRSLLFFCCVALCRVIILNCLLVTYLPTIYGDAPWLLQLQYVAEVMFLLALLASVYYTYSIASDALKIYAVLAIGDIFFSLVVMIPLGIVNMLEGRNYALITAPFLPLDLLISIIEGLIFYVLLLMGKRWFVSFRTATFHHPRITACLIIIFYLITIVDAVNPEYAGGIGTFIMFATMMIVYLLFTITLGQRVSRKQQVLQASQELLNSHFMTIQETISALEEQRQEIDEKMAELMAHDFPEDLTKDYLEDMKARKRDLHSALFTDFYMIDAMLSSKAKEYDTEGIAKDFQITVSTLGSISQLSLCQLLLALLQYGEEEGMRDVALKVAEFKHMLVITVTYSFMPQLKSVMKKIEKLSTGLSCDKAQEDQTIILSIDLN